MTSVGASACGWYGESIGEDDDAIAVDADGRPLSDTPEQPASLDEAGSAAAIARRATHYRTGHGVRQDTAKAAKLYREAANQGHAGAMNDLAVMYEKRIGVPADAEAAASWFRRAAEAGDPKAQHSLAVLFLEGRGVDVDPAQAAHWMRKAAERGHPTAFPQLALMFELGIGVPADSMRACMSQLLALRSGTAGDDRRCTVGQGALTQAQLVEARRLADSWKPLEPSASRRDQ